MHDIKWIKDNIEVFDKGMERRSIPSVSKEVIDLYKSYVLLLSKLQILQNERNNASKLIGMKKSKGEDSKLEIEKVANLKSDIVTPLQPNALCVFFAILRTSLYLDFLKLAGIMCLVFAALEYLAL